MSNLWLNSRIVRGALALLLVDAVQQQPSSSEKRTSDTLRVNPDLAELNVFVLIVTLPLRVQNKHKIRV